MTFFQSLFDSFNTKKNHSIKYFEVHLTEHCNLNCQSCFHFSPLAEEEYADLTTFENDFKRLSLLLNGEIKSFSLMGGEPLLHPKCTSFFEIARKYFPNACIQLVTNGILLNVQPVSFWESMQKYNIVLRPTKYPINIDWEQIEKMASNYNIKLEYYGVRKISCKIPICINGMLDSVQNYKKCVCTPCRILKKGKIYPCSIAGNIHHFIKYYNINIENSPLNGIDIYKVKNIFEIDKFLKKQIPLCKYCNGSGYRLYKKWAVSKKDINEWI